MRGDMTTLPDVPLEHVLPPGEPLQLNIFEPRYRALVADILAGGRCFGVVLITRGKEGAATTSAATWAPSHRSSPTGSLLTAGSSSHAPAAIGSASRWPPTTRATRWPM